MIRLAHALGIEIMANLAEHVVVPGFLEVRDDDLLGIGLGLGRRKSELARRPQSEQLVATSIRLEPQLLVMGELLLEAFLALVERGHGYLAASGADAFAGDRRRALFGPCPSNGCPGRRPGESPRVDSGSRASTP